MGEHVMCQRARQAHEGEDNVLVLARLPFYLERNRTFKARNSFYTTSLLKTFLVKWQKRKS